MVAGWQVDRISETWRSWTSSCNGYSGNGWTGTNGRRAQIQWVVDRNAGLVSRWKMAVVHNAVRGRSWDRPDSDFLRDRRDPSNHFARGGRPGLSRVFRSGRSCDRIFEVPGPPEQVDGARALPVSGTVGHSDGDFLSQDDNGCLLDR